MWNKPTEKQLRELPVLYSSENIPIMEKIIHMHFFLGGCDWYAAEYDVESQNFFGFAILNNDYEMSEWGYFSFMELCDLKVEFLEIDRDLYFKPTMAKEIERIVIAERRRSLSA